MDIKLVLGRSMDCFNIGESLRDVMLAMQHVMPEMRAAFLYESNSPVLNDIYIIHNVDCDDSDGARYLIEFDPFLQVVRAVNYSISTQLKPNSLWKLSGSCDIVQHRPLTAQDFISALGDPLQVFTVPQGQVLKLLYDGACFIFELVHPIAQVEDIQKVESHLTDVRLVPMEGSQFRCLIDRVFPLHSKDLSLYGVVQIGLVIENIFDQVVGINVTLPSMEDDDSSSLLTNATTYSRRVYFGQSCQCVMASLGAPDFVHYQQSPTALLMLPPRSHSGAVPQQFIFNYIQFGLDIVFDVDAKQVKKFIFHSNLPDHVDVNIYNRCFYKFGITETGFAKKGHSLLVHPGVTWSTVTRYVTESSVKLLSKLHRNDSTNALYPHPPTSVWTLFNQLICEVTAGDYIATISLCSLRSDQQLGILGKQDEALLVETNFQEAQNITEGYPPSSLSSVNDSMALCSSDVKISLPDKNDAQPQSIHHASIEVPSVEPHEESINMSSYISTDSNEIYHSFNNNGNQDDERGKKLSNCVKSRLPYPYPFRTYHPIQTNQMSPCSNNILITAQEDLSREVHSIDQCQFIHIEMFTEGASITACKEASDHILLESDKWRISCFSMEEQEAIDAPEELQVMRQQSWEEDFVCDSATMTIVEQPNAVTNNDVTTEFEEIKSTLDQEWLAKGEESSHNDEANKEHVISSDPVTVLPLEDGSTQVSYETDGVSEDTTDNRSPITSFAKVKTLKDGSNDTEEDKEMETELVYRPQSMKVAASRTQRILKTVTSLPKKRGEHQPKKKKSSSDVVKTTTTTTTNGSCDQKSKGIPNGAKVAKSPSTVRVDHRRVHFYTEEKSKAITAKLKPKESTAVIRRAHKDGTTYPHHHFKSDQLSALLQQNDGDSSGDHFPNKTPGTDIPSTFSRIFAGGDVSVPKAREVVQKINAPFATEYNSTVYTDQTTDWDNQSTNQDDQTTEQDNQTTDQDDLIASQDNQTADQNDQTGNQDNETTDQDDPTASQGNQTTDQDNQTANKDNQTVDQYDHMVSQGNQIADQDDQTASQQNLQTAAVDHTKLPISVESNNKISDDFNEEMSTLIKDFFSGTSTASGCLNQLELHDATSLLHVTEGHGGSEDVNISTTEDTSSNPDKQGSSVLLGNDTNSFLVTDDSGRHTPTEHNLSQGASSDEGDISQELTPRKQWSSTQLVHSTADSLNEVHMHYIFRPNVYIRAVRGVSHHNSQVPFL